MHRKKKVTRPQILAIAALCLWLASLPHVCCASQQAPRNIVLITLDTLRSDHTTYMGYPRNTTPFLAELARQGVLFRKMRTSIPYTRNSHEAMFTSKLPPNQQTIVNNTRPPAIPQEDTKDPQGLQTVQGILAARGYATAAFSSMEFMKVFKHRFQYYSDQPFPAGTPIYAMRRKAEQVVTAAIDWIQQNRQTERKFIWLHFFEPHYPYEKSMAYAPSPGEPDARQMKDYWQKRQGARFGIFKDDGEQTAVQLLNLYDGQLQYLDSQIRRFYEYFMSENPGQDTLWIIVPDHGEGLSSHSYYAHHMRLYEEQLATPAIFRYGTRYQPHADPCDANNADIMPTIAEMLGYQLDPKDIDGSSLLARLNEPGTPCNNTAAYAVTPVNLRMLDKTQPQQAQQHAQTPEMQGWQPEAVKKPQIPGRTPIDVPLKKREISPKHIIAIYDGKYKYIQSFRENPELYDLEKDPHEQHDISAKHPQITQSMEKMAKPYIERAMKIPPQNTKEATLPMSQDEKNQVRQLKSLGY